MKKNIAGKLEYVEIKTLKLHAGHERLAKLPDAKYQQLLKSMKRRGQKDPIEATDKLVVIDGRHRLQAAIELGWTHVWVLIRDDLADRPANEILRELLSANCIRRQPNLLEQVEVLLALLAHDEELDIPAITGASKKQVDRLTAIVQGPPALLAAVKDKTRGVSERLANEVLRLEGRQRTACLQLIRRGGNVAEELRELLASYRTARGKKPVQRPLSRLSQWLSALGSDIDELAAEITADQRPALQATIDLLTAVLAKAAAPGPRLRLATRATPSKAADIAPQLKLSLRTDKKAN